MQVTITEFELEQAENHGSVMVLSGTTEDGRWVRFGADTREAQSIIAAVQEYGEVEVVIEGWSVLGIGAA